VRRGNSLELLFDNVVGTVDELLHSPSESVIAWDRAFSGRGRSGTATGTLIEAARLRQ
jgi:hypothetical protein